MSRKIRRVVIARLQRAKSVKQDPVRHRHRTEAIARVRPLSVLHKVACGHDSTVTGKRVAL